MAARRFCLGFAIVEGIRRLGLFLIVFVPDWMMLTVLPMAGWDIASRNGIAVDFDDAGSTCFIDAKKFLFRLMCSISFRSYPPLVILCCCRT